ncbi:hypothetical protein CDL12_12883 [Handroanthus impetiginosus]|uniref:Uncharacterized protein n=1 Tax=Handroanthus impetiginosus TaxID=429701 RepID=A0A2G9HAC2_9LAMI|nr:hypothetical protein CDL12_12883 [Handroanthus impetiginosus]
MELEVPFSSNPDENEQVSSTTENPSTGQILMQLEPWISPYSARVREDIFQDFLTKYTTNENPGSSNIPDFSIPCSFPVLDSQTGIMLTSDAQISAPVIPIEVNSSDAIFRMSTESLCNIQAPSRFTCVTTITTKDNSIGMPQSLYNEMGIGFQSSNSNLSQFNSMEGQDQIGQVLNMDFNNSFNNGNPTTNGEDEDSCRINSNEIHENGQTTIYDNLLPQVNLGDNTLWTSKMQKSTSLWEWEDLLLDDNFNLQDNTI